MPPTVFSKNVDLKLIQLVKENPVLYNPRHPKYTDSDTREVTWQKIGDSLSRPAVEFAGIQCQIHFGDFQEDKHKSGFIENLKEYMPEHYVNGWNIEKKIFKEYKKHQGLSSVEAKHLYIKTARALPTYGVTFFLVKEKQKDKKKLVPRLLGINSEAILRLDETSKEILQTWPLTHVKTYHAAKGEIFTLNFGDYSDKEYSVKTCDAYKIRDILEAYIDLIRQRMMAHGHGSSQETSYITQDNVTSSQANLVQHVSNTAMKIVDQSLVGPSSIIDTELGSKASQGAQFVTVQQMIVSDKGQHTQQAIKSEIGMRGDMSIPFTRRLNRLNSNSVKIVTLLTEPSDTRMEDARKIVNEMNADLPFIREGVHETVEKQTNEEEKKKLQDQMNELDELMKLLTDHTTPGSADASEAGDAAMHIADVTTQMYFSLNSKLKRRSKIISRSRPSFVEDENTQKSLRKASFIAATATAVNSTHEATNTLEQEYTGPALDAQSRAEVEASAVDKLGKINAAIAHYIMAYSDPHNVDYDAAITSMNTINEIMPEYAKDAQALASCKDPNTKKQIILDSQALCDNIKKICSSSEGDDKEKMQQYIKDYTDTSGRLVFVFSKGKNNAKENEMLDLADEVASETSKLLLMAQELTQLAPDDPAAADVDAAGVKTADAAKDLITQVQLSAPTIHSPHCQSAVTAAAERLSSSVQRLAASWKPLEASHLPPRDSNLHHQIMELARALDRLKGAYSELGGDVEDVFDHPAGNQDQQRLKFISTLNGNKKQWREIDDLIAEPSPSAVSEKDSEEAHSRLSRRLGQLNAAIASLLAATADREHADYGSAELAVSTINELMPQLVQDSKLASANKDPASRAAMMDHIRALCDASRALCAVEDTPQNRSEAIAKFTNASGKLVFGASHRGNPHKEQKILKLTEEACNKTSQLVSGTNELVSALGGRETALLSEGERCIDAANTLRTTAQVTAHSIEEPRCQSTLLLSVERLSSAGQDLAASWRQLDRPRDQVEGLETTLGELQQKLDGLKGVCGGTDDLQQQVTTNDMETPRDQHKLKFIATLSDVGEQIQKAQNALEKPIPPPQSSDKTKAIQQRLSGRLGELNAAIAALLAATNREEPDYKAADDAAKNISQLMPYVVQDTQLTCADRDAEARAAMLDLLRELCEASRDICNKAKGNNSKGLNDAVIKYSDASGKLVYGVNPRANAFRENQIMGLTASASNNVSQLLALVEPLSQCCGPQGPQLDARGAAVADATQALVATAQVVAPSISEPHSKAALFSSIDQLAACNQLLADSWKPLLQDPNHQQQTQALEKHHKQLLDNLEALRKACLIPDAEVQSTESPADKMKFIATMSAAQENIKNAQKAFDKPIPSPLSTDKAEAVQLRLSGRLGELNAAIAALLNATADRERPDYKTAEAAIKTISELLPQVIQDSQLTSANKEAGARAAMLDLTRDLCEASAAVCAGEDPTDPQALSDAVTKFSEAAGKLVYVVNPRVNSDREREINSLSAGACQRAAHLLTGAQQLAKEVGGAAGCQLDAKGADMADATQALAHTTQVTSASISEPSCKKALLRSIDQLSSSSQQLAETWRPFLRDPVHQHQARTLEVPQEHLEIQLEELKKACHMPDGNAKIPELPRDLQRLQFVKTVSGAREQLENAQKALDKPIPPPLSSDKAEAVQLRLSGRLGELNAAIAALLNATADRERPDYKTAEEAVKTIAELLPLVVQDTQSSCANADAADRAAILDLTRELCEASRAFCAHAPDYNTQGLEDALSKFSDASNKLVHVANPRNNADRQKQIMDLSMDASKKASHLLSAVQKLPTSVEGKTGLELEAKSRCVDDAARALVDTARVTAPTISAPHCKQAMLSSADKLTSSAQDLVSTWKPLLQGYSYSTLRQPLQQLETRVEELKTACDIPDGDLQKPKTTHQEQQKLQFTNTMSNALQQIKKAQKALDRPLPPPNADKADLVQNRLAGRLGELNAAIAALLTATADREKPDYKAAEQAVKNITELMPHVVQDTQSTCANADAADRAAMLNIIRELCEASRAICDKSNGTNTDGLSDAVSKFSDASGKLVYVANPKLDPRREKQIMDLSKEACGQASLLLSGVQELSEAIGGSTGQALDCRGAAVVDDTQALLAAAQITAPTIASPQCGAILSSSADQLTASVQLLSSTWTPLFHDAQHGARASQLQAAAQQLQVQLDAVKRACSEGPKKKVQPAPARSTSVQRPKTVIEATREFLHRLRSEESQGHKPRPPTKAPKPAVTPRPEQGGHAMTDDEKRQLQLFVQSVEEAGRSIKKAEDDLKQSSKSQNLDTAISAGECMTKQARLQRNIALAGVEVASLVAANYADKLDYATATKSTQVLPQLMTAIVEDGTILSNTVNDESRRAFMQEMLQMCDAGRRICDAAKNDRENLNDAAIEFGDKSAKLLYIVSNDVDPTLEKEITTRAKAIGDSLANISIKAGGIASEGGACADAVPALCAAGARAQDAAGKLVYTAKLVAPSIYEPSSQQALFKSADNLSTELRGFTASWQPFASDPQHGDTVRELGKEADNLDRILEGLKSDVKDGRLGQLRDVQRLVVEDTPMRQLTLKIMEDAQKLSESPELTPTLKRDYADYCKKLSDALRALDLTNARCKRTPHDTNKRRELENAIQNLQMILLQSRPTRGNKERSNIVDLNDFIEEVTAEADKLATTTGSLKVPGFADKKTLENLNNNVQKMTKAAYALTHRDCDTGFVTNYDYILDVDQFGQECDEIVADIDRQLQSMEDAKAKNALLSKILPLTESCNMLRFATKSAISTAKGASLEATLDDLDDIESRVIKSIVKDEEVTAGVTLRPGKSIKPYDPTASINLSRAVCESQGCIPRAPVTAYIANAAASVDSDNRNQLLKHLYKLVHLLKTQTVTASQRLATWQPLDHPELVAITQQVLQEIQNPERKFRPENDKAKRIVNESDLAKLLVSSPAKVFGDNKQQEDKLTKLSTKLNSMTGNLMLSIASPESLTRSAHATSDAAVELASVARGCKDKKDPVQCERIEEAVQNMTFATYGLLKTAELACRDQDNPNARRRLKDAIGGLNDAIRRLMTSASTSSALQKECTSLTLALAAAMLQSEPGATSALPFQQCCQQLEQHQETIHKLKSEQPMSRQEIARSLVEINDAVCQTSAISSQCAYLISVSEKDSEIAEKGPVDVPRIQKCIASLQDACMVVIGSMNIQQAKGETEDFNKRVEDFSRALDEAQLKVKDGGVKATLTRAKASVTTSAADLSEALKQDQNMDKVTPSAVKLLEEVNRAHSLVESCPLVPSAGQMSPDTKARFEELTNNNKSVISHTLALVKEVSEADEDETLTWVTFNTSRTRLIDAYDALLKSIRVNGQRAGILEGAPEDEADEDAQSKTYLDTQVELANKWLKKPMCKAQVKTMGQQAVRHVIDIATKMSEDLKGSEREEIRNVITETEELLTQCAVTYDNEKYSVLMDRIKELKKAIQRGVVTRVVEDFIEVDDPVADLDVLVDSEPDSQKRAFLLERKIAELLAQLGRVTRTARCVADAGGARHDSAMIMECTEQTELLAPMLVQAAQERIACPDNKAVVDNYKALLAKYAESISKIRDLCDRAVDPMDFVQTAGEAMQRLREESTTQSDVQKAQTTSKAIIKLANRSIDVSMSSLAVRRDPELRAALLAAQSRVLAATPAADCRASRLPDWRESTAEVLRTAGEVESALGGENIFKKKPTAQQESNQQIYSVARDLHECVKDWSSRDNEIVAVARRMAVLMARLSEYMETDKKQAVIATSKSIVSESHEVAALARKLAHECTDLRIKTNLLQTCERIPTISAQLKMLTTVKSSTLGQQGSKEDTEAMDMLVGNAQSLMLSIQEVVKAAAGASVKIMSQRGPRLRWVRKNYY